MKIVYYAFLVIDVVVVGGLCCADTQVKAGAIIMAIIIGFFIWQFLRCFLHNKNGKANSLLPVLCCASLVYVVISRNISHNGSLLAYAMLYTPLALIVAQIVLLLVFDKDLEQDDDFLD